MKLSIEVLNECDKALASKIDYLCKCPENEKRNNQLRSLYMARNSIGLAIQEVLSNGSNT